MPLSFSLLATCLTFGMSTKVIPKGYVSMLGKLAEITDKGIPVHFFVGNHDMWMNGYFESELNIPVYYEPSYSHSMVKNFSLVMAMALVPVIMAINFSGRFFATGSARHYLASSPHILAWALHNTPVRVVVRQQGSNEEISWEKTKNG